MNPDVLVCPPGSLICLPDRDIDKRSPYILCPLCALCVSIFFFFLRLFCSRNRFFAPLLVALFAAATFSETADAQQTVTLSEEAKRNLQIELAPVERRPIHEILQTRGLLREQSDRLVWVTPRAKGIIASVLVRKAEKVSRGKVLFTVYTPELERLRAEMVRGMEKLKLLDIELARARSLVERKILAERELAQAETRRALALADAQAARRSILLLGMTEQELSTLFDRPEEPAYLPVHAPIGGFITEMEAYQGDTADPSRRVIRIMDVSVLWAEGDVFERDVPKIRAGQEADVTLRPFEDLTVNGTIESVSADLSASRRTAHIWIRVPNPTERLKPQMAVDIAILLGGKEDVLTVPNDAVLTEMGETFVFVANGDGYMKQKIVAGRRDHRFTEIASGLYEGDRVVTRGSHELRLALSSQTQAPGTDGHLHSH